MTSAEAGTARAEGKQGEADLATIDLRALAELAAPERAFLSFYGSGAASLQSLDDRARRIRGLVGGNEAELEHFESSLELLRERLPQNGDLGAPGLAVFACWALDFVKAYPLPVAPRDVLWLGSSPYLRPLAELQDEYVPFVVVAADNRRARIWQVVSAKAREPERVRGDVKNRVKKGGWSQKRYQRRRENELLHYGKDVAAALERLHGEEPFERLVLLGTSEILAEIREALPPPIAEKVIGERNVDLREGDDDEQIETAFELYFEQERCDEAALWDRIRAEIYGDGLAAAGPREVLAAAQAGRVDTMIVRRDAKIEGMRCRDCELLAVAKPQQCPQCKSSSVFPVDLVNELVELLATTSARAEFSDPLPGLEEVGDVAALLRW